MEICPAYFLETNLNCEKQMILLIISNKWNEGWYYLAVKKLSALLKRITSKHDRYFYFFNCLHSFRTENFMKLKSHEKMCKSKYFHGIVMPSEKGKILKFD